VTSSSFEVLILAFGDGSPDVNENKSFSVIDYGVNQKHVQRAVDDTWGSNAKVAAWPRDMEALRQAGLAGTDGVAPDQAVFRKGVSPAFAENSGYPTLAKASGDPLQAAYDGRQQMFASATGAPGFHQVEDYASVRRTGTKSSLPTRFTTTA
jgi:hypothetical protein